MRFYYSFHMNCEVLLQVMKILWGGENVASQDYLGWGGVLIGSNKSNIVLLRLGSIPYYTCSLSLTRTWELFKTNCSNSAHIWNLLILIRLNQLVERARHPELKFVKFQNDKSWRKKLYPAQNRWLFSHFSTKNNNNFHISLKKFLNLVWKTLAYKIEETY